jgi:GAF domain-containing protein
MNERLALLLSTLLFLSYYIPPALLLLIRILEKRRDDRRQQRRRQRRRRIRRRRRRLRLIKRSWLSTGNPPFVLPTILKATPSFSLSLSLSPSLPLSLRSRSRSTLTPSGVCIQPTVQTTTQHDRIYIGNDIQTDHLLPNTAPFASTVGVPLFASDIERQSSLLVFCYNALATTIFVACVRLRTWPAVHHRTA